MKLTTTLLSNDSNIVEYFFNGGFSITIRTYTGSDLLGYEFHGCMPMSKYTELLIWIQKNKEMIRKDINYENN